MPAANLCVNQNFTARSCAESLRRPPRHRRDACSMAWRCRFLAARPSRSAAPDTLVDFHTGAHAARNGRPEAHGLEPVAPLGGLAGLDDVRRSSLQDADAAAGRLGAGPERAGAAAAGRRRPAARGATERRPAHRRDEPRAASVAERHRAETSAGAAAAQERASRVVLVHRNINS